MYVSQSTQLHMGNHVASLLHQDHIFRAPRGSPILRLSSSRLSHKFCFLWKQLHNFNLPIPILKAFFRKHYIYSLFDKKFYFVINSYILLIYKRPNFKGSSEPHYDLSSLWQMSLGATRGWWSLSKRSKVTRDLQRSAFLTVKFHVRKLSVPRVFFPLRVKSWMKNMIASFWELDLRWAFQHLSKKSVAFASGGFRKAWIVDRVSHPIWNFLRSRKTSWFHVNVELLDRRSFFENLHLDSKDKLVYYPILKCFRVEIRVCCEVLVVSAL